MEYGDEKIYTKEIERYFHEDLIFISIVINIDLLYRLWYAYIYSIFGVFWVVFQVFLEFQL